LDLRPKRQKLSPFQLICIKRARRLRATGFFCARWLLASKHFEGKIMHWLFKRAKVVVDQARRRDIILHDAEDLAFAERDFELIEGPALLDEVAG